MSSNPFTIPIGTSDPVNLCYGLPLFPSLGTARAGAYSSSRSSKLIDISVTVLATRVKVSAYASYAVGICGPAIAFLSRNVDVFRADSGDTGELTLTFNEGLRMEAGAFMGMSIGAGVTFGLQVYVPKPWYKLWAFGWQDAFTVDLGFSVDFITLLWELVQYLLSGNPKTSFTQDSQNRLKDAILGVAVRTYMLVDTVGSSTTVGPDLEAAPGFTLPINLVNLVPKLKAANDALSKVGAELSVGPSLHLLFPVTFNFDRFTVVEGGASADYGPASYVGGNQVRATGSTRFNTGVKPSRVTTHVTYETSFTLAVSIHFKVTMAKFFNFEVNSRSLDLSRLLYGPPESNRSGLVSNSVSTSVAGGCVLTPRMTLTFTGPSGPNFQTGQPLRGTVSLPGLSSGATVTLAIEPEVAGFPAEIMIPAGSNNAGFTFTFPNGCLATGNPNDPSETAPPSHVSPLQTYTVSAKLSSSSDNPYPNPCSDYEVEVPLNVANRFLRCQRTVLIVAGTAPPWDSHAGATLNADTTLPALPGKPVLPGGLLSCWFPYLPSEPTETIPVTFTLLDENRQLHTGSNVVISLTAGGAGVRLNPSATFRVTLHRSFGPSSFVVWWYSKGPYVGYSNRFYLVLNAGCQYGQTEFWLDVWNWS